MFKNTKLSLLFILFIPVLALSLVGCQKKEKEIVVGQQDNQQTASTTVIFTDVPVIDLDQEEKIVSTKKEIDNIIAPTPRQVQIALKNAGYYKGKIDGKIGPKSKQAILNFQRDNKLRVDGKVGPKTWSKLKVYLR